MLLSLGRGSVKRKQAISSPYTSCCTVLIMKPSALRKESNDLGKILDLSLSLCII